MHNMTCVILSQTSSPCSFHTLCSCCQWGGFLSDLERLPAATSSGHLWEFTFVSVLNEIDDQQFLCLSDFVFTANFLTDTYMHCYLFKGKICTSWVFFSQNYLKNRNNRTG